MRTVVIDTNVLLSDPGVVNTFSDAHVVIPEMVLPEIDKLKTARVDPELRYKGRQISRILFELSEKGNLHDGVEIPGGSVLRVTGLPDSAGVPSGLNGRNADDRIVAVALRVASETSEPVTLVTNDLNMLLKAQSYGLDVERVDTDESVAHRLLVRPFQRYKGALGILAVAVAVFAATIYLYVASQSRTVEMTNLPEEFTQLLSAEQQQMLPYLIRVQRDPKNTDALIYLATAYDSLAQNQSEYLPYAIQYWQRVLKIDPGNNNARTDLATDDLREGKVDDAIRELNLVLVNNPDHINANLNLGIMYMNKTPKLYQKAADQFARTMELTKGNADQAATYDHAKALLDQVVKEAKTAGQPVTVEGSTS